MNCTMKEKEVPAWTKELKSVGKYYFNGVVDNLDIFLELHRCNTLCMHDTRTRKIIHSGQFPCYISLNCVWYVTDIIVIFTSRGEIV